MDRITINGGGHMKRTVKFILATVICMLSVFSIALTTVRSDETLKATSVKVDVEVSEYNILTITETIDIEFLTPHHGILRTIPLENTIVKEDGSTYTRHAELYDFDCNQPYSVSRSSDEFTARIGEADKEITGPMQYVISYKYDLGNDRLKDADELYINIIGTGWTYEIEHLEVAIHMPKDFEPLRFGVTHGKWGSQDYSGVMQKMEGKDIYLKYEQTLQPGEAFTVRLVVPEGYFKKEFSLVRILAGVATSIVALVTGFLNWLLYRRFGKPDPVVQTVEFYPPENLNPPRLFYILHNYVDSKSVNGLLLTIASKGYLTIETPSRTQYRFVLYDRDTNDLDDEERIYYKGLWELGTPQSDGTRIVKKEDLEYQFYDTINKIRSNIMRYSDRIYKRGRGIFSFINIICGLAILFIGPTAVFATVSIWRFEWYHWAAVILSVITGIYLFILGCCYRKRTEKNNILYGRALGFREFIDVADRDRIEALAEENPMYFYDILPYAYALELSDKWMKNFEGMLLEPVSWYRGDDLDHFMNFTMTDYYFDSTSSNSYSSGDSDSGWSSSSDSGGGSSGGGSGGGGSAGW